MSYNQRRQKGDYAGLREGPYIYRLYHGDRVVYVGQTNNLPKRLRDHETDQGYWGSYDYKPASSEKEERLEQEQRAINANNPTRNFV